MYMNKKMEELDERQKNGETTTGCMARDDDDKTMIHGDPALMALLQVDENAPMHEVLYEGSMHQKHTSTFQLSSMGCYVCRLNFSSPASFEDHVEEHGDESDFKILKDYSKSASPIFKLSYNLCINSHYFRFNLESTRPNIVIDKLVIVQSRSFYYVHNTRVPYELGADGKDNFFVDSHLFRKSVVQPIVVVFHDKSSKEMRYVEQHHFCRVEEFPVVKLSINPCRLSNSIKFKPKFNLPTYMPPKEIRHALQSQIVESSLAELSNEFKDYLDNNRTMTQSNMREAMLKLLQIEDSDTIQEYSSLVQHNVKLRKYGGEYIVKLKIPKNTRYENVIFPYDDVIVLPPDEVPQTLGDIMNKMEQFVYEPGVKKSSNKKNKPFLGRIESISYGRVAFKCARDIPIDKTYTILFRPARMVIRYQYRALEQLVAIPPLVLKKFLFPEKVMVQELPALSLELFNKAINTSPEQLQAIQYVVNNSVEKSAPYIIFGPPGTGKTTTLVEAILQIYMLQPQSHILVTAGSNGACDEIALRLCNVLARMDETQAIIRIYSRSYEHRSDNINELLLEYSNLYAEHFLPDVQVLHNYRIVVCTLSLVGRLSTGKFGKQIDGSGVFTHIFIDEVAASTEAEALVVLMPTISPTATLVISGDHRQLGPILNSTHAAAMGLEVSLMERLLKRDCYRVDEQGNYNPAVQTRLRRNYRSHHEIVNLYNKMYYDGQLKAEADPAVEQLCRDWSRSPNPDYPIIFHSIFGHEQRDNNSTSRYNPLEISVVMDYVRDLLYFGIKGKKLKQEDIGIISPYKKQYMRIQEELNLRNWYEIETGAVESFQGKEKTIIIVSFVRSFSKTLGFLDSPKRLNVTLSRARSLLILIGNPKTLSINDDFKHIIEQCQLHKTLVGATYHESDISGSNTSQNDKTNDEATQKLAKSMKKLNVSKENLAEDKKNGAKPKIISLNEWIKTQGNAVGGQANESASAADDALKSKNSSTFKTVKTASTKKQRQTFALYKGVHLNYLHLNEGANSSTANNINTAMKNSELDDFLKELPRVPKRQHHQHNEHNFEIPPRPSTFDEDLEEIRDRLNQLHKKSLPLRQTCEPATESHTSTAANKKVQWRSTSTAANNNDQWRSTVTAANNKNQLRNTSTAANNNAQGGRTSTSANNNDQWRSTSTAANNNDQWRSTSTAANNNAQGGRTSTAANNNVQLLNTTTAANNNDTAVKNNVQSQNTSTYVSIKTPISAIRYTTTSEYTKPPSTTISGTAPPYVQSTWKPTGNGRVFVGHEEYPTSSRYVRVHTQPTQKPKSSKKSCIIA
ncbi:putative helicase MOV-10 isoform X2 [Anastrepha ludens]|nr:putative helicase MOV-10 isoform X2 [Anastrepha ludens]